MRRLVTSLTLAAFTTSALACPAYVPASELKDLPAGARRDVRLFALTADGATRRWTSLPVQVDPLDEHGVLLAPPETSDLGSQPLAPNDRVTLRREAFGARVAATDPAPCRATAAVELADPETPDRFAYLVACQDAPAPAAAPVALDQAKHVINAPRFSYDYQPNNQLMYKQLLAKGPWGAPLVAGSDADLNLHFDVKKFFTMDFDNRDVESYVVRAETGPVGVVASIDFFLRILFFKINLKMATTAGFYADAGHIPALIDVPVDASKMLNPGSGLLYTWIRKAAAVDQSHPEKTMPNADPKLIASGYEALAKAGLPYCQGATCTFRLRGAVGTETFALDVNVPKTMVERGFYPQWIDDVAAFRKGLGWSGGDDAVKDQVAVYFDNSGLPKGQYRIDQWIRIGKAADVASTCPRPVKVGPRVALPAAVAH